MDIIITDNPQKFLEVAIAAVKNAEPSFRTHFGRSGVVHTKNNPRHWVTDADREIEQLIVKILSAHFPDHGIIGEEFSPTATPKNRFVWYLDPIDGTSMYIHGISSCCISLGLSDESGPLAGVIFNPETGELFHAVRGVGAFKNDKRIRVSAVSDTALSFGSLGWGSRKEASGLFSKLIPHIGKVRVLGSSAWQLCLLAEGKLDFFIATGLHSWDIAAAVLIGTEAGGSISNFEGEPFLLSSPNMIATNGRFHGEYIELVKKCRA